MLQSCPGPRATNHRWVGAQHRGWSCGSGAAARWAGLGCLPGAGPAPAAVLASALGLDYWLKRGHQRGTTTTRVPGCLPGSPLPHSGRATPRKMPSPHLAARPSTAAFPHGAGKAGCRYPGVGLRQHQALLPSWAEPMQVVSPWEVHPGAPPAPRLRQHRGPGAGGLEPGKTLGSQARRSRGGAAIPAWKAPGARQCRGSWADGGGCQEQATASLQPHLPVRCQGAWGWAQHLT